MRLALLGLLLLAAATLCAFFLPPASALACSIVALALFVALLVRGIASVRSGLIEPTIWRSADPDERRVAITFDDGPDPYGTPRVLDALRERRVRATFFVVGERVRAHPDIVRRIVAEGHEVACHSDVHSRFSPFRRFGKLRAELEACLGSIREVTGLTPRLYRPPYGLRSPANAGVARSLDLLVIGMARRGFDQSDGADAAHVASRVVASVRGGEIIALHDGPEPGRRAAAQPGATPCLAAEALPAILDGIAERGLEPATVSDLLAERPYRESPERPWTGRSRGGRFGNAFFSWVVRMAGPRVAAIFVVPVACWFVAAAGPARRASIDLRRRLHGPAPAVVELWWAWRHFFVFGRGLLDRVARAHGQERPLTIERIGWDRVSDLVSKPGGVLILSAHFGDWSLAARAFGSEHREISVLAYRGMGLGADQARRGAAVPFTPIDVSGSPESVASAIASALGRGGAVAALGDRVMGGGAVQVPFLGAEAPLPRGLWVVALVTRVPVVVALAVPAGRDRMRIYFDGPILVEPASRDDREAAVRRAAARYAAFLGERVRAEPFHWANFFDFWGRP